MKTMRVLAPLLILIVLLVSWGNTSGKAQTVDTQYFPETGHNVRGEFLKFYKVAKDPRLVYGYPITEQITSKDGKTAQYFQRARFELIGNSVQLTSLGQLTYKPGPQLNSGNGFGCRQYATGYSVCFAFLDVFNANGGVAQFGNPISPFESHENLITQYFEKARFEWRGDRPEGQRVVITELGRIYFDQLGEDPAHLKPVDPLDATIRPILSLRVRAFVLKAITLSSGQQTVYIVAQDQTLKAVSNATGKAIIRWPDGHREEYPFTTNSSGVGIITFNFADQKKGELVYVDVTIAYQNLTGTTSTSFRIWY